MTAPALRPYLPADAPRLAEIFRESVLELAVDDYDDDQRDAWASVADDAPAFAERLAAMLTIVATRDGEPVGFASLEDGDMIAMLYIHPDECIDCAACEPVCPVEAIQPQQKLEAAWEPFQLVAREAVEPIGTPGGSTKVTLPLRVRADWWLIMGVCGVGCPSGSGSRPGG